MVDRDPLAWAPVTSSLSTDGIAFDTSYLGTEVEAHDVWTVIHNDSVTRIEREGNLVGFISQVPPVGSRPTILSKLSATLSSFQDWASQILS